MSKMEDMQSYFDEYPEALRKARASSSLTLAELARISGVPWRSLQQHLLRQLRRYEAAAALLLCGNL